MKEIKLSKNISLYFKDIEKGMYKIELHDFAELEIWYDILDFRGLKDLKNNYKEYIETYNI